MIERELTGLEQRLYEFLDDIDTIVEYDCDYEKWNRIREKMKRCKEDCKVQFGVINNGATYAERKNYYGAMARLQHHNDMATEKNRDYLATSNKWTDVKERIETLLR